MDVKIIVATHKKYQMPEDKMYIPLHVGKAGKKAIGYMGDDASDNISTDNPRFCELTGVYWAWKNISADYIGLTHYRRHFTEKNIIQRLGKNKFDCIITEQSVKELLKQYDLILPTKRKYYIESMYSHYVHLPYTYEKDVKVLRQVISEMQPEYVQAFDVVMHRRSAHMFNMFVMRKEIFDKYCEWLFPILFEVDRRIDISNYSSMETRVIGFLGEFMIDVWNEKQKILYKEIPVMFMEKQNWIAKGGKFIYRKMQGLKRS